MDGEYSPPASTANKFLLPEGWEQHLESIKSKTIVDITEMLQQSQF